MLELLSDGWPRTMAEISAALQISIGQTRAVVMRLEALNSIHVCARAPDGRSYVYRLGALPLPVTQRHTPSHESLSRTADDDGPFLADDAEREAALDRRHRTDGKWWPVADPIVSAAMFALASQPITRLSTATSPPERDND
ncbi:hypothetical protein [Burkholderia thailandensis]|uniref:hypothetical protein n=1 Tax=Burkholderia thailandensis TaxID=57975 RepID=UPI002D78504E|nr:hypothetical protein [Burkholderia thailandensis]WRS69863.1 hypothetical protein U9S59_29905 [Burkholderia thailandensis]